MNTRNKTLKVAATIALMVAGLSGCGTLGRATPAFKPTGGDAAQAFAAVAAKSCAYANRVGMAQTGTDGTEMVLVPKSKAIEGFSAAYRDSNHSYGLIYETDGLNACALANEIALLAESGTPITSTAGRQALAKTTRIQTDSRPNTYDITSNVDGTRVYEQYVVSHGLVAQINYGDSKSALNQQIDIRYGTTAADIAVLRTAVKKRI